MTDVGLAAADLSRRGRRALVHRDVGALSDAALVIAMARGRSDALAEAYRRHGPSIYRLAHDRWGQRRAEHETMEIFLALWRRPETVDLDKGSLRAHLLAHLPRTGTTTKTIEHRMSSRRGREPGRVEVLRR